MSRRKHVKKIIIRPRFFVILAVILGLVLGAAVYFAGQGQQKQKASGDMTEQGFRIMMSARAYISNDKLRYDDAYFAGGYPPDDIGVCTDVVWKGLNGAGISIKNLMDADISAHFSAYDDLISVADPNIDFRLVPQMERYLERRAISLDTDVDNYFAWQAGDIVTFESSHVAIVSSLRNVWGRPYIIQHGKDPAAEEDRIFASDGMKISGHFRMPEVIL